MSDVCQKAGDGMGTPQCGLVDCRVMGDDVCWPKGDEGFQVQVPVHAVDCRVTMDVCWEELEKVSTFYQVQLMGDVCQREMGGFQVQVPVHFLKCS